MFGIAEFFSKNYWPETKILAFLPGKEIYDNIYTVWQIVGSFNFEFLDWIVEFDSTEPVCRLDFVTRFLADLHSFSSFVNIIKIYSWNSLLHINYGWLFIIHYRIRFI